MSDIAKAYVQIIPTAEGIKGSLDNMFSNEASSAGEKAGSGFSGGLTKALGGVAKVTAGAVTAASAAVGAITKTAVDNFADYEQLEGGIETLFGSAAPTVMYNAQKAFETAGMSMNEYMETSIGSAAALISSLGGDQVKAAKLMDVSMVDMADNVNKMGTSMEAVQNAYKGFSKGNFTMLDNLALGFSGSKEGMQQLLDKAKEISGVSFNIDSYADIVQAIHVVQEDMGIAGTTAKEGAETISGSLSTLGAAWQNLMTGIANPDSDLGLMIQNVVKAAENVLKNMMPAIEQALSGVSQLVERIAPVIADKLPGLLETILPSLLRAATHLITALAETLPSLVQELLPPIIDAATQIITAIAKIIPQLISTLLTTAPEIISSLMQAGFDLILDLTEGLKEPEAVQSIIDAVINIIDTMVMWLGEYANVLVDAAVKIIVTLVEALTNPDNIARVVDMSIFLITSILDALINAAPQLMEAAPVIILNLLTALVENAPKILDAAVALIENFIDGLTENGPEVIEQGVELVLKIVAGLIKAIPKIVLASLEIIGKIKDAFKNVDWLQLGKDILNGLITGIKNSLGNLEDAVKDAAKTALNGAKKFLGIKSPSRVFRDQVGQMIDLGLAEGIDEYTSPIQKAMNSLSDMTQNGLNVATQLTAPQAYQTSALAPAGYGDLTIPVYIGQTKFTQAVVTANQINKFRSGGR